MFRRSVFLELVLVATTAAFQAQAQNEPYWPQPPADAGPAHPDIDSHQVLVDKFNDGVLALYDMRQLGLSVFSTPFNTYDGFGDGPFDPAETDTRAPGMRPTLQGNGLVLRINGLDAQSCNECHTIVKNGTRPPTLGIGGVGGIVQQAIIMPTMIDVADSSDDRTSYTGGHDPDMPLSFDGSADMSGRFSNPPFLFGGGGVELLGKEMTADLQDALHVAETSPAGTVVGLDTHGVSFGSLTSLGGGAVDFDNVEGVSRDLVVRPFGRKGESFSMRDFDRGAMQFHLGIQPVEVVGAGVDADGDGVVDEVTVGEMTALHIFDVANPRPVKHRLKTKADKRDDSAGSALFRDLGCADCHRPALVTRERSVPLAFPEIPDEPFSNVYASVRLTKADFDPVRGAGVRVPLFSDLKRHDMGPRLAETLEASVPPLEIPNNHFITARLWGIADTAPYLHDGRATTLYQAIWYHGGEAEGARDDFMELLSSDQKLLLSFLGRLRTPKRPNEELLPLP
jgi:hypothetical protein